MGGIRYEGFLAPQVFLNLLIDNAFLLVVAVGMTFVILTGGIDLSVGAVVAFTTVLLASLVQQHGLASARGDGVHAGSWARPSVPRWGS